MNALKDNFFVKAANAYLSIIYKLYPVLILYFIAQSIISIIQFISSGNLNSSHFDFLNLFGIEKLESRYHPSLISVVVILTLNLVSIVGIYIGIKKLYYFFKNVFEENPFAEENGKYLKYIGILIIGLTTIAYWAKVISFYFGVASSVIGATEQVLLTSAGILSVVFNPFFILGIFVFVFGEIIIRAAKIKQEIELTV